MERFKGLLDGNQDEPYCDDVFADAYLGRLETDVAAGEFLAVFGALAARGRKLAVHFSARGDRDALARLEAVRAALEDARRHERAHGVGSLRKAQPGTDPLVSAYLADTPSATSAALTAAPGAVKAAAARIGATVTAKAKGAAARVKRGKPAPAAPEPAPDPVEAAPGGQA
jgi:hypothetical protein